MTRRLLGFEFWSIFGMAISTAMWLVGCTIGVVLEAHWVTWLSVVVSLVGAVLGVGTFVLKLNTVLDKAYREGQLSRNAEAEYLKRLLRTAAHDMARHSPAMHPKAGEILRELEHMYGRSDA